MSQRGRPPIGPRLEVRLEPELVERLDELAARLGVKRAELARRLLTEAVARG